MAVAAAGWVGSSHPEITPPSNFHHLRDTTCPGIEGLCARHPSQLYEALLEGLLLGTLLLVLAWRRGWLRRPGALFGTFLVGYGLARSFVEFFRQPDAQFVTAENPMGHALHFGNWSLTMGQALSLPMTVPGIGVLWLSFWRSNSGRISVDGRRSRTRPPA